MEREGFLRINGNGGGESYHTRTGGSSSPTRSLPISSPPPAAVGVGANGGLNYIVHTVSKYDTLAGVAIKYGVEVADIKRLNGLVTDLQMFALKTIHIPLPGRHPPSPVLSNGHGTPPRPISSQQAASSRRHSDLFDSLSSLKLKSSSEQKVSLAMSRLQGYYGLRPANQKGAAEGCEMAVYQKGSAHYLEDGPLPKSSPISNPPLSLNRKSKSAANCLETENGSLIDQDLSQEAESNDSAKWADNLVRRRQKSEADFTSRTPEKLLKEENTGGTAISAITGKGLALRPKSASRTVSLGVDGEAGGFNPIPIGLGDSFLTDDTNGVRKSSSGSSLQDSENGALSSIWSTSKWSLKPDFQALSAAAITIPIFDRRNKAAVD
ncbi:peptidoglycan-binding LysM domain-containing protein [Perilla frutescens var. frutescens]|nr:peptidoglycan-binding LysM domain-containing protein [Perilla frutescens var. frutescens]